MYMYYKYETLRYLNQNEPKSINLTIKTNDSTLSMKRADSTSSVFARKVLVAIQVRDQQLGPTLSRSR